MTNDLGDVMAAQLRQDALTQSRRGDIELAQHLVSACAAAWQQQRWHQEQEKEWEGHLKSLQQCICELLIKNQNLRDSLMSATQLQCKEPEDEYDRNVKRN
jgi:hypothetical protein